MTAPASPAQDPRLPRLCLIGGEPAGVGTELLVRIAHRPQACELVAVADPALLERAARAVGLPPLTLTAFQPKAPPQPHRPGTLALVEVTAPLLPVPGVLELGNVPYVLNTLCLACDLVQRGDADALVTGPVHKGAINAAGIPFTGHTEFLAERTGAPLPVMMLVAGSLRVALATTHLPLAAVPAALTAARLEAVLRILQAGLGRWYGIHQPRIAVCGLNPHAGEGGALGREEEEIIAPLLQRLRAEGLDLTGPLPADTAFLPGRLAAADVILTMYHDQGLPVLKHHAFDRAVNVTLGLPILRTSPDHGTALELAGTGQASPGSLQAAIDEAARALRLAWAAASCGDA
jgi:4-hydroxythreonine-4-phosphate dehydrogenase